MICPKCNTSTPDDDGYCFDCGSQMVKPSVPEQSEKPKFANKEEYFKWKAELSKGKDKIPEPIEKITTTIKFNKSIQNNTKKPQEENRDWFLCINFIITAVAILLGIGFWIVSFDNDAPLIEGLYSFGFLLLLVQCGFFVVYGKNIGAAFIYNILSAIIIFGILIYDIKRTDYFLKPSENDLIQATQQRLQLVPIDNCQDKILKIGKDAEIIRVNLNETYDDTAILHGNIYVMEYNVDVRLLTDVECTKYMLVGNPKEIAFLEHYRAMKGLGYAPPQYTAYTETYKKGSELTFFREVSYEKVELGWKAYKLNFKGYRVLSGPEEPVNANATLSTILDENYWKKVFDDMGMDNTTSIKEYENKIIARNEATSRAMDVFKAENKLDESFLAGLETYCLNTYRINIAIKKTEQLKDDEKILESIKNKLLTRIPENSIRKSNRKLTTCDN